MNTITSKSATTSDYSAVTCAITVDMNTVTICSTIDPHTNSRCASGKLSASAATGPTCNK